MSNTTPHFATNTLHNGTSTTNQPGVNEPVSEHWQHQLQLVAESRQAISTPHHHCKKDGVSRVNKATEQPNVEESPGEGEEERNRATTNGEMRRQDWDAMDLSGQGLRALSPSLFIDYMFLGKLYIDNNRLTHLHPAIGRLRSLTHLDASNNDLMAIPEEIGMLVNLKSLLLFDNNISLLPYEIGYLFKLETLGIEGNPLDEEMKEEIVRNGTKALVTHLRENTAGKRWCSPNIILVLCKATLTFPAGPPPNQRDWHILDDTPASETLSVLSYNILCDKYATSSQFGYTPSDVLSWDYRKDLIINEVKGHDADFICMQEVDMESYNEFFRRELSLQYKGVFWPKSRAKTMAEREAKSVDGCATFYNHRKYQLLDKQLIDFANTAINRPDMKGEHDTFNRVMPRDHIAVATFFENRVTGSRFIVVNAHIFWDPAYKDVKLVQVAILMEQLSDFADKWAKHPPCTDKELFRHSELDGEANPSGSPEEPPTVFGSSLEYSSGSQIPLIMCGDFNSGVGSGVYDLITQGSLSGNHSDLANRGYGNFTRDGMEHPFSLKSAYSGTAELSFTNYTATFQGVLDYIWFSTNSLQIRGVLGDVDREYLRKVPGFPNHHFPSDHLPLRAEFSVKSRKERKVVEADFGPQRERRS